MRLQYKSILKVVGIALLFEGIFMLAGIPFSWYFGDNDIAALLWSSIITVFFGGILYFSFPRRLLASIGKREGYVIVSIVWFVLGAFGALPYLLSGSIHSFTDAFFETVSGFSTTGASILTDIEVVPHGVLFWRSITHWMGGLGVIVLAIAILPFFGFGGMQLYAAEVPGPSKDKLHPRIKDTARRLWAIYLMLTLAEVIMLLLGKMPLFDALCHSFGTVATGGFGTKNTSIAGYSPYIQYVIAFFMLFAGTNFALYYQLGKGNFAKVFKDEELRFYLGVVLVPTALITLLLFFQSNFAGADALRHSFFQVVSIITCTGFATTDYMIWPVPGWMMIFFLMFAGGMVGSTSGGIKMMRHLILLKRIRMSVIRILHPSAYSPVRFNGTPIGAEILKNIVAIFILYILTFVIGSAVLAFLGVGVLESFGGVATCMGGIGPGLGTVGPVGNFSALPDAGKWVLSFLMILGRLELLTILIILNPSFWKK